MASGGGTNGATPIRSVMRNLSGAYASYIAVDQRISLHHAEVLSLAWQIGGMKKVRELQREYPWKFGFANRSE